MKADHLKILLYIQLGLWLVFILLHLPAFCAAMLFGVVYTFYKWSQAEDRETREAVLRACELISKGRDI